jgi:uncharacterized protein YacL
VGRLMENTSGRDAVLLIIRGLLITVGALIGFLVAGLIFHDAVNTAYLTVLGALVASLVTRRPALLLRNWVADAGGSLTALPPETALAATIGAILALVISVLLNSILSSVPGFAWYHSVGLAALMIIFFMAMGVRYRAVFQPLARQTPSEPRHGNYPAFTPKILDTSVIIDGRVIDVAQTGFLEGPLVVPSFVLRELQTLADQGDPLRRARGRRGLEVLERVHALGENSLVVREFPDGEGGVDDRLVRAANEMRAVLVTNDSALGKIAVLHGVKVLNVNELAEALRPKHGAGDEITVTIVKDGSKPGQGIGYLEDGTMVVIEDGVALRGRTVKVSVVSSSQTALGRMIFARPKEVV